MDNILDRIVIDIKEKIETSKRRYPVVTLEKAELFGRECFSMKKSIRERDGKAVIAEFKRRSPSKGLINGDADVKDVCKGYQDAGVAAVSVLTNATFFGGCNEYLTAARTVLDIPILRKEFIVDEYQIIEAKAIGADFILLIAEILTKDEVKKFTKIAHDLGMEVLMELHGEDQVDKIIPELDAVGINNRNLKDFSVDIERSIEMANNLPKETIKVAESGLTDPETVKRMAKEGFNAFLMGEKFMFDVDPAAVCAEFISNI